MKSNFIILLTSVVVSGCFYSCNDFLDTMPDKRTEIDNPSKVKDILLSAYPTLHPTIMFEFMSDNYEDNGDNYSGPMNLAIEAYHWIDPVESDWDSPQEVWDANYKAIASANQALKAIEELGTPDECISYKAEALLCRAYGHFQLANTFCMAYNSSTASKNLGIPYITSPEETVGVVYERGTLEETYEKINADIEEALPLIKGVSFDIPLYHFNEKAAYAFAARFNLFYGKDYEKVITYATNAIGDDPTDILRDLNGYSEFTTTKEWTYGYIDSDEPANLLLITNRSMYGRTGNQRYGITDAIFRSQLAWSYFPGNKQLAVYNTVFHHDYMSYFVPKMTEIFEITNQIAQTGQPHVVIPAFTTDETLLCRAEAYALLKRYDESARDLSYWYMKKGIDAHSANEIIDFYKTPDKDEKPNPNVKQLNTGVDYTEEQAYLIHAILHARRVECLHEGMRWLDIKRYGISYQHNVYNSEPITLLPDDPRKAIQIPQEVLSAPGNMTPNPR